MPVSSSHQHHQSNSMNQLGTVYATKRRRRNGKSIKPAPKDGMTKSNPSKRHRERLNAELDTLASLLPFEQNILSKLDRLSILRLSVSYLRTKSYFQVSINKDNDENGLMSSLIHRNNRDLTVFEHMNLDGEMFLQALNGFLMILTCEGEVFFATHNIEGYLGFHQSDIVHQSVYELVHSEDREELQRQLMWNSFLHQDSSNITLHEIILPENYHLLERSFTVRFRCLLDNTSGFLRLDIRGRIKVLHGQNKKTEDPPLCLFAICTPFGPPSLLELPQKEVMFKSKHKLDFTLVSMDQRGKTMLGYSENELSNMSGYELVHYDDLAYVASAHQELLKTGASGMIAYRLQTKDFQWQWLQTSSRLVYKNSKPDFIISTHRPLMEEEGRDLLGKRTMDFKISYLDAGLPNSYFTENEVLANTSPQTITTTVTPSTSVPLPTANRVNRRYKPQIRDFLSTCRTKRKVNSIHSNTQQQTQQQPSPIEPNTTSLINPIATNTDYLNTESTYNMYGGTNYHTAAATATEQNISHYVGHTAPNFYQPATLDNRYLSATTDNIYHQFRPITSYYPDYHAATSGTSAVAAATYTGNSFLDIPSRNPACTFPAYDHATNAASAYQLTSRIDDKIYQCHQPVVDSTKYAYIDNSRNYMMQSVSAAKCIDVSWPYSVSPSSGIIQPIQVSSKLPIKHSPSHDLTPKHEDIKQESPNSTTPFHNSTSSSSPNNNHTTEVTRQTVLMWGSCNNNKTNMNHYNHSPSTRSNTLKSPMNSSYDNNNVEHYKWNSISSNTDSTRSSKDEDVSIASSQSSSPIISSKQGHQTHQNSRIVMVL